MKINKKCTIIMYHFVRELKHSRYPQIKGLDVSFFKEQINYLHKNYQFITMEMLLTSIETGCSLPDKSILLTFDDAYIDHYLYVFPILHQYNIQGSFFPPSKAITENKVLDVNKIHFILAAENNELKIINEIYYQLNKYRNQYELQSNEYYYEKLAKSYRFDKPEIIFIKRLLQVELEETLREKIINNLFEKIVNRDEISFSRELYMNVDQIKCMKRNGMHIGSHGYNHYWLNSLTEFEQREEVLKGLTFLKDLDVDLNNWTMCYPYGAYDESLIKILKEYNCKLGLTTIVDIADLSKHNPFKLPRLDTNDIPINNKLSVNKWYGLA